MLGEYNFESNIVFTPCNGLPHLANKEEKHEPVPKTGIVFFFLLSFFLFQIRRLCLKTATILNRILLKIETYDLILLDLCFLLF
jgi:hypothetical protein